MISMSCLPFLIKLVMVSIKTLSCFWLIMSKLKMMRNPKTVQNGNLVFSKTIHLLKGPWLIFGRAKRKIIHAIVLENIFKKWRQKVRFLNILQIRLPYHQGCQSGKNNQCHFKARQKNNQCHGTMALARLAPLHIILPMSLSGLNNLFFLQVMAVP